MTNRKQPQAGEWWQKEDTRVRVVGAKKNGVTVGETECGHLMVFSHIHDWQHLPDCDSFEWQPEVWPKWYVREVPTLSFRGKLIAYSRRDNNTSGETFHIDGTSYRWSENVQDGWIEITEAEAIARVTPKAAPLPALIPGIATDRMVDLFLSWRLPSDFRPDGGISFESRPIHEDWPTGTNLFTSSQARKMIERLLSVPEETARVTPVEVFPQYWTTKAGDSERPVAYAVRESKDVWAIRYKDGTTYNFDVLPWSAKDRKQLTKEQAEALLSPQESPDDWVEITDPEHIPRDGVDWFNGGANNSWIVHESRHVRSTLGEYRKAWANGRFRCRRKDLPPLSVYNPETFTSDWGPFPTC